MPQRPPFRRRCQIVTSGHAEQARLSTIGHAVRCTQAPDYAHPAPPPGAQPCVGKRRPRPAGHLPVPGIADLTSVVHRCCYEHAETGEAEVTMRDVVAVLRLAHGIEHDAALAERDAALRRIEEWRHGLWSIRNAIVRQRGRPPGRRSRPRPRGTGRRCGRAALDAAVAALIQPRRRRCAASSRVDRRTDNRGKTTLQPQLARAPGIGLAGSHCARPSPGK